MRKLLFLPILALALACEDQPVAPQVDQSVEAPAFNFMNGPANPGNSGVYRFQDWTLLWTTDPQRDLGATHYQSDDWLSCGGTQGFPLSDVQLVTNPQGAHDAVHQLAKAGDIPVLIYRLSDVPGWSNPAVMCAFLADGWLYRGTHRMVLTDNDLFVDGPGANAFGMSAHGTVEDPSGTPCTYTEQQRAVSLPNGEFKTTVENIRVHCASE